MVGRRPSLPSDPIKVPRGDLWPRVQDDTFRERAIITAVVTFYTLVVLSLGFLIGRCV
jgi:hypothetical protein